MVVADPVPHHGEDRAEGDTMSGLDEQLARWRGAGLITPEQAQEIAAFEAGRPADAPAAAPRQVVRQPRSTLAAEAIGYVGAALAVGAVILLVQDVWEQLVVGGRIALVGVLTLLTAAAATALHRTAKPPLQRLTSVLFTAAIFGVGWIMVLLTVDLAAWREADAALATTATTTITATGLYVWRRRALPQLTALVSGLLLAGALFMRPAITVEPLWVGLLFWAIGAAWLLLGLGGWLRPRAVAEVTGGALALLAVQFASFDGHRVLLLTLGLATAAALVTVAVTAERGHHLAVGAVGLFILVPQLAFELFGDAIGAPATLLVVGLLLVLLAVGLGRARQEVRSTSEGGGVA